ncbi:quinone oxidoreductase-like protein 2 isoform X2 [Protopterus annectens]|uniref:quinone oxidoreductase-like protein 2 isoform X2 n=1 Tax=Protopterus annectens TaxID=7888 RepID=UPI001CF9AB89|nr:quinone oxidoreductase-like protein 2 isoform X2 [Protopterus annectens]
MARNFACLVTKNFAYWRKQTLLQQLFQRFCRNSASWRGMPKLAAVNVFSTPFRKYQAAVCTELKKPLLIQDIPASPLKPNEVRVDIHCCGVNLGDILSCQGQYPEWPPLPFIPGMEFAGYVTETGTSVVSVKQGDRVLGFSPQKAMAEECVIDHKFLWQVPQDVSFREAAALPVSYGTAIAALHHRACTQPGDTVLVTAGAGAAGLAALDIASNVLGAKVITAAGSDEKCQLTLQRGAVASINYRTQSIKEEVKKLTAKKGVNVVFDAVGGDIFMDAVSSLCWEGRVVIVGFAGGLIPSLPTNLLLLKNIAAVGVYWGGYPDENFTTFSDTICSAIRYCQEGKIKPYIGGVYALHEVSQVSPQDASVPSQS